jgi:hypothetical protein
VGKLQKSSPDFFFWKSSLFYGQGKIDEIQNLLRQGNTNLTTDGSRTQTEYGMDLDWGRTGIGICGLELVVDRKWYMWTRIGGGQAVVYVDSDWWRTGGGICDVGHGPKCPDLSRCSRIGWNPAKNTKNTGKNGEKSQEKHSRISPMTHPLDS